MLDIQFIRDNPDKVKKSTENKNYDPKIVDEVLALDKKRRELLQKIEALRAERNQLTRFDLVKGKKIKNKLKEFEPALKEIEKKLKELMYQLPNPAAKDVKTGKNETENEVVRKWGKIRKPEFAVKDHAELGEKLGIPLPEFVELSLKALQAISGDLGL